MKKEKKTSTVLPSKIDVTILKWNVLESIKSLKMYNVVYTLSKDTSYMN